MSTSEPTARACLARTASTPVGYMKATTFDDNSGTDRPFARPTDHRSGTRSLPPRHPGVYPPACGPASTAYPRPPAPAGGYPTRRALRPGVPMNHPCDDPAYRDFTNLLLPAQRLRITTVPCRVR